MMTLAAGLLGAVLLGSVLDLALDDEDEDGDIAGDDAGDPAAETGAGGDLLDLAASGHGNAAIGEAPEDAVDGSWLAGAEDAELRDYLGHDGAADSFVFGPNPEGPAPVVSDYDPAADRLVLGYDAAGAPPDIAVAPDPADAGNVIVFADGLAVALVRNGAGLTAGMIHLQPFADAA